MTTRESQWTEQDRAEILALALYRSWLCPRCGGPLDECTSDSETGTQFQASRRRCRATYELIALQEEAKNLDRQESLLFSVTKKE